MTLDLQVMIDQTIPKSSSKKSPKVAPDPDDAADLKPNRRRMTRLSETSDGGSDGSLEGEDYQNTVSQLLEMFPYACSLEVGHCLQLVAGDVERAAQLIMHRHEAGQSLKPIAKKVIYIRNFYNTVATNKVIISFQPISVNKIDYDDKAVKERILGKYGFVDQEEDSRYHRPTLKKHVIRIILFN